MSKMERASVDDNNLPIGRTISNCKEDIRSILYRLKDFYAPCDLDTARGFSENLIKSLNKVFDDFIADFEQDNSSNGISENDAIKNKEDFNSIVILDSENEPELEIKSECTANTGAQYETTSRAVINGAQTKASTLGTDSMGSSSMNEVANTSTSKNRSNHSEKTSQKTCAHTSRTNKSKKTKVKRTDVGARNYHKKPRNKLRGNIKCEVCRKVFPAFARLIFHRRIHLEELPIHCRICFHSFSEEKQRSIHENDCDKVRYECYACKSTHSHIGHLESHMRIHSGIKPFKCSVCNKAFAHKYMMLRHIASIHEHKKPFNCEVCPMQFSQKDNLNKHRDRKHGAQKRKKNQLNVVAPKRIKREYEYIINEW